MLKRINKTRLGFTLIELLVVIAIIGILASIVLASLNSARVKARDARRIADIRQIQLALELFADANGQSYPAGDEAATAASEYQGIATAYISAVPADPTDGTSATLGYQYQALSANATAATLCTTSTGCAFYHLGASLEQTNNSALSGDADACTVTSTTGCKKAFTNTTVDGDDGDACASTVTTRSCYDVTP